MSESNTYYEEEPIDGIDDTDDTDDTVESGIILSEEEESSVPQLAEEAAALRDYDMLRGVTALEKFGYTRDDSIFKEYLQLTSAKNYNNKDIPSKKKAAFTAKFMLQTFEVLKLNETQVFYIGHSGNPLFKKCQSVEELSAYVSYWYQVFFGFSTDIQDATKALIAGILPQDHYPEVSRSYIQVTDNIYWDIDNATHIPTLKLPPNTRVFARMFDTAYEDANVFKVPNFDDEDELLFRITYWELKNLPYADWPDEYHFQCFKDWSANRKDVEFGMFTVLALPFMKPTIMRGSIFNVGEGHNGKSVLLGLATSMVGGRNTTQVSGNDLGKWDYLVDLQTTWFNCPSETELEFLKENTGAFKTLSAHETFSIRKKHGDASVPVKGAFPIVFNINKLPELGDDAPAILSRMFINNFDVDFEAEGKAVKDYARKTFLADKDTMPKLTGMVLAFAHYYSQPEHMWEASPSMKAELAALTDIATPQKRYVEWFKFFFEGYAGITLLKTDYTTFGRQEGEEYDTSKISQSTLIFKQFKRRSTSNGTFYMLPKDAYPVKRFLVSKNLYIRKYMGTMTWEEYHNDGNSIVYAMMLDYLARDEEYRKYLKLYLETRTDDEIKKKVLQDMWKDIEEAQKGAPYERW